MTNLKQARHEKLGKITHAVRAAQVVLQYGVGAMVDFPDQTLMTAAPEYWQHNIAEIHDARLEKVLGVNRFGMPKDKAENKEGVAYVRFPKWYFCPKCRTFQPLRKWFKEYRQKAGHARLERDPYMKKPRCMRCNGIELVPTRIVVACRAGHIDDFPWIKWVHERNSHGKIPICTNPELKFKTGANSSAGLEGLKVECACGATASLYRSFTKDELKKLLDNYSCSGYMPWKNEYAACNETPQAMQRGASRIYYPKVDSSLVIPPYSDRLVESIQASERYKNCLVFIRELNDLDDDKRKECIYARLDNWSEELGLEIGRKPDIIKPFLEMLLIMPGKEDMEEKENEIEQEIYRHAEYEALTGVVNDRALSDGDFIREEMAITKYNIPGLSQIVLLHKIREVRALIGFTRLDPYSSGQLGIPTTDVNRFQCVKEPDTDWYPGYQVLGEGIFLNFDDNIFNNWFNNNNDAIERIERMKYNYRNSMYGNSGRRIITSKFVFLHTLAHLLIRQLSFECGYNSASLRERIYCDAFDPTFPMSGILIYTASGDAEGTLGGLVRQGRPDCLPQIFQRSLINARWCSNDPVCIQSGGQGREALNLAACHACSLIPETSCEEFNLFLDRGLVIGMYNNKNIGFYSQWMEEQI